MDGFSNFLEFIALVDERNKLEKASGGSEIHGITKFAGLSNAELLRMLGYKRKQTFSGIEVEVKKAMFTVPQFLGVRTKSDWTGIYTTPIKDQGKCGSCWAFSAIEQIETDSIRAGLSTVNDTLSIQQVVSCDARSGGCNGGTTDAAYKYILRNHGVESATAYPYSSYLDYNTTAACSVHKNDTKVSLVLSSIFLPFLTYYVQFYHYFQVLKITGFYGIEGVESAMIDYVLTTGPLSVCMDATDWYSYTGGVMTSCPGREINHCVQVVGVDAVNMVWKIRNSWHKDWGENGYMFVKAGINACGITYDPTFVSVKM